ncbi:MAG: hypothetical protein HOP10_16955 [Chitinophagaceae bacterium]|nr:hypothetical protein [Chitinophagaceae bacterium]
MRFLNCRALPIVWIAGLLAVISCKQKTKIIKSPPHYSFKEALVKKIDIRLKEISGLVWDKEKEVFLSHYDESGNLFVLDKGTYDVLTPSPYKFGKKGDYEDIALYNGVPYILESNGTITKLVWDSAGVHGVEAGKIGITGTNDFETMYADTARKALILICKNCDMDNKKTVSAFAFYPDSIGFVNDPVYRIDAAMVDSMSPFKTSKLQPSAARIHPISNKLYIVSSAASMIVIADLDGKPEGVFQLGEKLFPQPEGLTFKNDGTMFISNEGVTSKGTILKIPYKE